MVAQTATTSGTQLEKEKNHLSKAQASSIRGINNGRRGFSSLRLFRNSLASSKLKPLLFLPPIWANTSSTKSPTSISHLEHKTLFYGTNVSHINTISASRVQDITPQENYFSGKMERVIMSVQEAQAVKYADRGSSKLFIRKDNKKTEREREEEKSKVSE